MVGSHFGIEAVMKLLTFASLCVFSHAASAQVSLFEGPILPTANQCFIYMSTSQNAGSRESQLCVKSVGSGEIEFSNGQVFDQNNFNETKHRTRTLELKTGVLSSKPGCWPTGQQCGVSAFPLKDAKFSVDGLVLNVGAWQAIFSQFNVKTSVVKCTVLEKEETCFESIVDAKDRANNGASHDTEASRIFVLTGPAKGWPLEIKYKSTPPGQLSVFRLLK